jgi:hypothetical protein
MCDACWDINDPKWKSCSAHGRAPCPYGCSDSTPLAYYLNEYGEEA